LAVAPFSKYDAKILDGLSIDDDRGGSKPKIFGPLEYSGSEAVMAQRTFGGLLLLDTAATRRAFLENCERYSTLILATHAKADERVKEYAFLAFAPEKGGKTDSLLYISEIYGLPIQADLVVLSGCETGSGQVSGDEGVISLARAFTQAGARSVVSALWPISDASTERVMLQFYKKRYKGASKSAALRAGQMAMFSPPSSREKTRYDNLKLDWTRWAHPYFWAAFSLHGAP
jgi:CHAT domain-containing protein